MSDEIDEFDCKKTRLRSGYSLQPWPAHWERPDILRLAILSVRGALKGVLEFTKEDMADVIDALQAAADLPRMERPK
jgi:hypothetical protein